MPFSVRHVAVAAALTLAGAGTLASAAQPDAALQSAAQAAQPALVQSLKEMVSIESGSANAKGLAQMAAYTEKRLQALGAKVERMPVTKGPGAWSGPPSPVPANAASC